MSWPDPIIPRDPERMIVVLGKFAELWARHPDYRFGQLLFNLTGEYDSFHIEDDTLEQQIDLALSGGHPYL